MFASIFIIAVSLILFVYWFRYTCLLILSTRTARDYTRHVAEANGLEFLETRSRLMSGLQAEQSPLDHLHSSLDRDYQLVTYLLRHATGCQPGAVTFEQIVLRLDYKLMCVWYRITKPLSVRMARGALIEMTSVVSHLANAMGERTAVSIEA